MNKKNLTKRDLIKKISKETGFSYNYSKKLFNDFFEVLILNIKEGELNLKNLGSFKLINKKQGWEEIQRLMKNLQLPLENQSVLKYLKKY